MKEQLRKLITKAISMLLGIARYEGRDWEDKRMILGARVLMANDAWRVPSISDGGGGGGWLAIKEFSVYSQFGDDGIIQYLCLRLNIVNGNFIEFGVGDFFESNTHFLCVNNNWRGFVMDGSEQNMEKIRKSSIYWRHDITAKTAFVNRDNINALLAESGFEHIQLLHIDLDGNDYWILHALDLSRFNPDILILEYNAHFGSERAITVPYDPEFDRCVAHHSGQYYGASLAALESLARGKGYYFIGCNSAGNNAYFLANRHLASIPAISLSTGFVAAKFRDSRNEDGLLTYLSHTEAGQLIRGLPVVNVERGAVEPF
jgi:hypothetical protein